MDSPGRQLQESLSFEMMDDMLDMENMASGSPFKPSRALQRSPLSHDVLPLGEVDMNSFEYLIKASSPVKSRSPRPKTAVGNDYDGRRTSTSSLLPMKRRNLFGSDSMTISPKKVKTRTSMHKVVVTHLSPRKSLDAPRTSRTSTRAPPSSLHITSNCSPHVPAEEYPLDFLHTVAKTGSPFKASKSLPRSPTDSPRRSLDTLTKEELILQIEQEKWKRAQLELQLSSQTQQQQQLVVMSPQPTPISLRDGLSEKQVAMELIKMDMERIAQMKDSSLAFLDGTLNRGVKAPSNVKSKTSIAAHNRTQFLLNIYQSHGKFQDLSWEKFVDIVVSEKGFGTGATLSVHKFNDVQEAYLTKATELSGRKT